MTDDELRGLLPLAAVGALSDEEQMDVDAELEGRPDLRAKLDGLRAVTATMADAVADAPPPGLRARLLDAIAETPQLAPVPPVEVVAPPVDEPLAPVVPIAAARRRRWAALGAVAAAVIVLLVGVLVVSPFGDDGTDDQVAAVLEDDDAQTIEMAGELAGLSIVHSAAEDAAVLTADDIPIPEGDRVYELWAIRGSNAPERVDTFRPDDDGNVTLLLEGIDPASVVWAVTEEPAGGSETPTLPILAATA